MENYQKMSTRINLDLKNSKNIEQIGNLKKFGEIENIARNKRHVQQWSKDKVLLSPNYQISSTSKEKIM